MNTRAERINQSIQAAGYSYGELSKNTGIPKSALQRYATGETAKVPIDRIELIAKATDVSAAYLMGWNNEQSPKPLFSKKEMRMIQHYRGLDREDKKLVDNLIASLLQKNARNNKKDPSQKIRTYMQEHAEIDQPEDN